MKSKRTFKVVITDREYERIDQEKRILEEIGAQVYAYQYREPEQILRVAKDCDALIVQYAKVPKSLIDVLSCCRIIARYATGIDGIDLQAAGKKGIYVSNVRDYCTEEVAVHTLALTLSLSRKIGNYDQMIKNRVWDYKAGLPCFNIQDQIVGIIGYGKIAKSYAKKVRDMGGCVWIASDHANEAELAKEGFQLKSKIELISQADYISIHTPLTEATRNMFCKETFLQMKKTAYLINVSRGGMICENDLAWALREGQIAGAALDVMEKEPPEKGNELLGLDNIILTPHIAWYSEKAQEKLQASVAKEVARVLVGRSPENCVNLNFFDN